VILLTAERIDFANKNIRSPVKLEFQIRFFFSKYVPNIAY
jgi:hypothetical protein